MDLTTPPPEFRSICAECHCFESSFQFFPLDIAMQVEESPASLPAAGPAALRLRLTQTSLLKCVPARAHGLL